MNRGQFVGTTFNGPARDKYLTIADDCKVFLVNPTTGDSTQQLYDLSTLDNTDVYGTNEIVYQFDANGYVNLIYIVAKGGAESNRDPATQIQSVTLSTTCVDNYNESTACPITVTNVTGNPFNYVNPQTIPTTAVTGSGQWYYFVADPAATDNWHVAGATFITGNLYKLVVTLKAADGYVFADKATLQVTGIFSSMNQSIAISDDGRTATITYTY